MFHAGLDTSAYPGDAMIRRLHMETDCAFFAYYLVAPSHPNAGWTGKRAFLQDELGTGTAVVYVGQERIGPGSHNCTPTQGSIDGADAVRRMRADGFQSGSWCFLDLEAPDPETGYLEAWCTALKTGSYSPGVYCSHLIAPVVATLVPSARLWVYEVANTSYGPFPGTMLPQLNPAGSGYAEAFMWQHIDEARLTNFDDLPCDLDVCLQKDPSAP